MKSSMVETQPIVFFHRTHEEMMMAKRALGRTGEGRVLFCRDVLDAPKRPDVVVSLTSFLWSLWSGLSPSMSETSFQPRAQKSLVLVDDMNFSPQALVEILQRFPMGTLKALTICPAKNDEEKREVISRFFKVITSPDPERRIISARWEKDLLVVKSGRFKSLAVPGQEIGKVLVGGHKFDIPQSLGDFEIDGRGSFLYWKSADVHVGWEQLEQSVFPEKRLKALQETKRFNNEYGLAIKTLREERGLCQKEIDGLDERHVRRIEKGHQRITSAAIECLATAHGFSPNDYLREVAKRIPKSKEKLTLHKPS